jgi:hypothetical protein
MFTVREVWRQTLAGFIPFRYLFIMENFPNIINILSFLYLYLRMKIIKSTRKL